MAWPDGWRTIPTSAAPFAGKLSGRYEITPTLAIRSTLSNAFKAPSLIQENYTSSASSVAQGNAAGALAGAAHRQPAGRRAGRQAAEAGKVAELFHRRGVGAGQEQLADGGTCTASASATSSTIRKPCRTAATAPSTATWCPIGYPSGTIARFFVNGMDTTTSGLDISARHQIVHNGLGVWDLSAGPVGGQDHGRTTSSRPPPCWPAPG